MNVLHFYIAPIYDITKISLCICIYFIQSFMNVILYYDVICISILSVCLEIPVCSDHPSYEHYLYPCFLCISFSPLFMLHIYSCMYWKSGTSDLLVLMFLLYNVPTINKIFFLLLLRLLYFYAGPYTERNFSRRGRYRYLCRYVGRSLGGSDSGGGGWLPVCVGVHVPHGKKL